MKKKYAVLATILALIMISRPTLAEICAENEYVMAGFSGLSCQACPASMINKAGDDTESGQTTSCDLVDEELVTLEFETPSKRHELTLLSDSGWPLSLKVTVPYTSIDFDTGGLLRKAWPGRSEAGSGFGGFVIFENNVPCFQEDDDNVILDVDGFTLPFGQTRTACAIFPPPQFEDARYIRYNSDVDDAGVPDVGRSGKGKPELRDALTYSEGSRGPELQKISPTGECVPGTADYETLSGPPNFGDCVSFGPDMGGDVIDGWGIGTDDDLPGMFIYSSKGVGLVWDEPFIQLAHPAAVRNLAGMLNSVSYEISDLKSKEEKNKDKKKQKLGKFVESFNIFASMNVYAGVFSSMMFVDPNGIPTYKPELASYQLDGQPPIDLPDELDFPAASFSTCIDNTFLGFLRKDTYEVRAFMVSGEAPAQLNDYNTDGLVNVQDAIDDPSITVISNEASVQFLQYSENILSAGGVIRAMFADLDDSGDIEEPSCGGGQGSNATRGALR